MYKMSDYNDIILKNVAKPLHIQRLEAYLDLRPFLHHAQKILAKPLDSSESECEENLKSMSHETSSYVDSVSIVRPESQKTSNLGSKEERQNFKSHVYNFNYLTSDREWLYETLLTDTESDSNFSDEDNYINNLLKSHISEQKLRENFYKKAKHVQCAYFGSGLLSIQDLYSDSKQIGFRKRKRLSKKKPHNIKRSYIDFGYHDKGKNNFQTIPDSGEIDSDYLENYAFGNATTSNTHEEIVDYFNDINTKETQQSLSTKVPGLMVTRRRRIWQLMAKKEIGRCLRYKTNNHKECLQNCKRVSSLCMKLVRQRALWSQKVMKETLWRAKRLTREMLGYWKRYERVERDTRRRLEREAEEQRKIDVEIIETKRQQRKLNFLITQTELYAHFMSKKLGHGSEEEQLRILNQLDEEINPRLLSCENYDPEHMKKLAIHNAQAAVNTDRDKAKKFNIDPNFALNIESESENVSNELNKDLPQPSIFKGQLKGYQIKGLTWIANLYDQGISGILADEMGLGKTVQSIAFLCHIAEKYGVWGPFLIISPASTLHNWQQEMERFVPDFKLIPYWGSPNDRKVLRHFWDQKALHTRQASFHVVITSYQLIVSDYKYFNRIKWQYMILDEAQAIKSASSMRWKLLLGFNCRNRLLLSGTPIQNSMAELWALLHFIMPTLFDSHDEFNEWFSKDIESHAENKTGIDEKQISRLHMILKPFMLRRIKKDVENELSDKIEIMVYCPLTTRQKLLYTALKKKIRIEDLLHLTRSSTDNVDKNFTTNLMNLVMQFRKVCNHPELFERRDVRTPFSMRCLEYTVPRLIFNEGFLNRTKTSKHLLIYNRLSILKAEYIHSSIFKKLSSNKNLRKYRFLDLSDNSSCFSFTRLCDITPQELEDITIGGLLNMLVHYKYLMEFYKLIIYRTEWWSNSHSTKRFVLLEPFLKQMEMRLTTLKKFIFTSMTTNECKVYMFGNYTTFHIQETVEHRFIRNKCNIKKLLFHESDQLEKGFQKDDYQVKSDISLNNDAVYGCTTPLLTLFQHKNRLPTTFICEPLEMPRFLQGICQSVQAYSRRMYCDSRAAEWAYIRHIQCENSSGLNLLTEAVNYSRPEFGWFAVNIPDKETLVTDAGKLAVLDSLLKRLKDQGHRVLIYSQMTKMIDLLEEYMWHRKHRYMRLDGSSKISARRDMVADFQARSDIFVFLLSTRAGGLGINLTAADTVIFYDSDWNPTVDQQAMDRAHRLGQTKQVTVYRLICKGTIEERILRRAREKSEIQRMVISGGNFRPDTLKPKEVVSLLLDDDETILKCNNYIDESRSEALHKRIKNQYTSAEQHSCITKPQEVEDSLEFSNHLKTEVDDSTLSNPDKMNSPIEVGNIEPFVPGATSIIQIEESKEAVSEGYHGIGSPILFDFNDMYEPARRRHNPRGTKRGRPRGSTKRVLPICRKDPPKASDSCDTQFITESMPDSQLDSEDTEKCLASNTVQPIRRGPGRPRLKTRVNQGIRGTPRTRKPNRPLVVPLGRSPAHTPIDGSPNSSPVSIDVLQDRIPMM